MNKVFNMFGMQFRFHKGPARILRVNWNNYYTVESVSDTSDVPNPLWTVDTGSDYMNPDGSEGIRIYERGKPTIVTGSIINANINVASGIMSTKLNVSGQINVNGIQIVPNKLMLPDQMCIQSSDGKTWVYNGKQWVELQP